MQSAEKLTPTFIIKLVVLFALLLVGVFYKTNNLSQPANVNTYISSPSTEPSNTTVNQSVYPTVKQEDSNKASI